MSYQRQSADLGQIAKRTIWSLPLDNCRRSAENNTETCIQFSQACVAFFSFIKFYHSTKFNQNPSRCDLVTVDMAWNYSCVIILGVWIGVPWTAYTCNVVGVALGTNCDVAFLCNSLFAVGRNVTCNGASQAPYYSIYSTQLSEATIFLKDLPCGAYVRFRTSGQLFNLSILGASTKEFE